MNKSTKGLIAFSIIIILIFSFYYWFIVKSDYCGMMPRGYTFCIEKGYDGTTIGGSYSEKFGKVTCVSCYNYDCKREEFNVIKKWGIIKELVELGEKK